MTRSTYAFCHGDSQRRSYLLDVHPFEGGRDVREDRIAIVQEILGASFSGKAFRSCCAVHTAVGCAVTATWTICRRSCAKMTRTKSSRKVTVGTTKRSAAMIWLA